MTRLSTILLAIAFSLNAFSEVKVYSAKEKKEISIQELFQQLPGKGTIVLGEEHYNERVQLAQRFLIEGVVKTAKRQGDFVVGWEFLQAHEQQAVDHYYALLKEGHLSAHNFMLKMKGTLSLKSMASLFDQLGSKEISQEEFVSTSYSMVESAARALTYTPIIDMTQKNDGELLAVNASNEARQIMRWNTPAFPDRLLPENFEVGNENYKERFMATMDHIRKRHPIPPEHFESSYLAQCLSDSVMAETLMASSKSLKFLIVGSFHADYNDGVVEQIEKLSPSGDPVVNVRILRAERENLAKVSEAVTKGDPKYGKVADYLLVLVEDKKQASATEVQPKD